MKTEGNGLGICSVLFIVFMVLKLCNVISWSWWWVTAPLWGGVLITIAAIIIIIVAGLFIRRKK